MPGFCIHVFSQALAENPVHIPNCNSHLGVGHTVLDPWVFESRDLKG